MRSDWCKFGGLDHGDRPCDRNEFNSVYLLYGGFGCGLIVDFCLRGLLTRCHPMGMSLMV